MTATAKVMPNSGTSMPTSLARGRRFSPNTILNTPCASTVVSHLIAETPAAREPRADRAAGSGKDDALGEDLAHQLPAAGAEREACRQLATPSRPSGEKEIRDVGAHDQEHDGHRAQEDPQDGADAGMSAPP